MNCIYARNAVAKLPLRIPHFKTLINLVKKILNKIEKDMCRTVEAGERNDCNSHLTRPNLNIMLEGSFNNYKQQSRGSQNL